MMRPAAQQVKEWAEADARIVAAWLEGSVARGDVTGVSDLDVHVAVSAADWRSLVSGARTFLEQLGNIVALQEAGSDCAWILSAVLTAPTWIDLTIERSDRAQEGVRTEHPVVLFDRDGCTSRVRTDPDQLARLRAAHLDQIETSASWLIAHGARVMEVADPTLTHEYMNRLIGSVLAPLLVLSKGDLPRPHGDHARRMTTEDHARFARWLAVVPGSEALIELMHEIVQVFEQVAARPSYPLRRAATIVDQEHHP